MTDMRDRHPKIERHRKTEDGKFLALSWLTGRAPERPAVGEVSEAKLNTEVRRICKDGREAERERDRKLDPQE